MPAGAGPHGGSGTFRSLREHRNYRLYFGAQIVSYSGTFVQDTALPWLVLALTHSPFQVGLLVLCRFGRSPCSACSPGRRRTDSTTASC